jgi:hypothetical protein
MGASPSLLSPRYTSFSKRDNSESQSDLTARTRNEKWSVVRTVPPARGMLSLAMPCLAMALKKKTDPLEMEIKIKLCMYVNRTSLAAVSKSPPNIFFGSSNKTRDGYKQGVGGGIHILTETVKY